MINLKNSSSLTDFQRNARSVIENLNQNKDPLLLTVNGTVQAVLVDPDTYQEFEKNRLIMMIAEGEKDITEGRTQSWETVRKKLEAHENVSS